MDESQIVIIRTPQFKTERKLLGKNKQHFFKNRAFGKHTDHEFIDTSKIFVGAAVRRAQHPGCLTQAAAPAARALASGSPQGSPAAILTPARTSLRKSRQQPRVQTELTNRRSGSSSRARRTPPLNTASAFQRLGNDHAGRARAFPKDYTQLQIMFSKYNF